MSRALAAAARTLLTAAVASTAVLLTAGSAFAAGGGIEIMPTPAKLIPLIALFALMIVPVNRLIIQPMLKVLDERDERIAGARARAGEIGKRADEVLRAYQASVGGAREEAESERRARLDQARGVQAERIGRERGEAEQRLAEARREVNEALEQARTGLRSQAEDLARQATERMLGRSLS